MNKLLTLFLFVQIILLPAVSNAQSAKNQLNDLRKKTEKALKENSDSVVYYGNKGLKLAQQLKDIKTEVALSNALGQFEYTKGDYHKAVPIYVNAIKRAEQRPPFIELCGLLYSASEVYRRISIDTSASLIKRGLAIAEKFKNMELIADGNNRLGYSYEIRDKIDSAMICYQKSLKLNLQINHELGTSYCYESIAGLHNRNNRPDLALDFLRKSYALRIKVKDKFAQSLSLINLGETFKLAKKTDSAVYYARQAIKVGTEINNLHLVQYSNNFLSDIYKEKGDYKTALSYRDESFVVRDSIFNEAKSKQIEEINTKYQTEKKEQQIHELHQRDTIQRLKIKEKNVMLWSVITLLLLAIAVAYLTINRRKLKEQTKLQQEINKQQDLAAKAILDAEERERSRIATDLHDGVGQLISTALMNLNNLVATVPFQTDQEKEKADNVVALINESYDEMRSISHQMMPNALLKAGLSAAVRDFLNKIDREKIGVNLEVLGFQDKLDQQVETVLYRVIQEAVNNVIKHAEASKLNIQLCNDEDGISITIEDNGKGFDPAVENPGIGLKNISTRIAFLKGTVDFDSAKGKGTLVAIHIPAES
jgi:two-component system NarL family sensor kinase